MTSEEYAEQCKADPLWFAECNLKIQPLEGGLTSFRLNHHQFQFVNALWKDWKAGEPVRYIILKARRRGFSTLIEALAYWMTSNYPQRNALIVANDLDTAHNILQMTHRFVTNDERRVFGCMPEMARSNRSEVVFDTSDWRERGERHGLDSRILVASADKKATGRSFTLNFFHGSEVAHWTDATLVTGFVDALSHTPETMGFLESTANGKNGYFYQTWKQAERGKGMWKPWFCSWVGDPDCRMRMSEQQILRFREGMTEVEWELEKKHGLQVQELAWRRKKIESYEGSGRNPEDVFRQEWPITADEAFIGSGRQYFDMGSVSWYEERAKEAKPVEGWLEMVGPVVKNRPTAVKFHPRKPLDGKQSMLKVWKMPEHGQDYVVGADVAMGLSGGDASVAYVLKRQTLEFVACLAGQIEPDRFADLLVELAWFYNEAFLCPENNSIGMAVSKRTSARYVRHAYQVDLSHPHNPTFNLDKPGWNTNNGNRREMFGYLRQLIRDKQVFIWDEDFVAECNDFVVPESRDGSSHEDRPRAIQHKHDDRVAAAAITLQANDPMLAGPIRKMKSMTQEVKGWREQAAVKDIDTEIQKPGSHWDDHVGRV